MEPKKFTIPFSVLSEDRKEPFTPDLEAAALYALSELGREKAGGLIVKQAGEKILFISKIGYPLWMISWFGKVLVFDGLGREKCTVPYAELPEVKPFMEDLKRGLKTRENYSAFLKENIAYFQSANEDTALMVVGLMANSDFLADFKKSQEQLIRVEESSENIALLTPIIDDEAISTEVQKIENLFVSFQKDVENLQKCMSFLNKALRHYTKELSRLAKAVNLEFNLKIDAEKERVAPVVADIEDEYDKRIEGLTKHYENQRIPIQKEILKLEKEKKQALAKIELYKEAAKKASEEDKQTVEKKWKEKVKETKTHLSQIEQKLGETEEAIKSLEERRGLETIKLKDALEAKTSEIMKNLQELETSRDARLLAKEQEKQFLEAETKKIIEQVGRALKLRDGDITNFSKLGVTIELGAKTNALFYAPFCVTCYQAEREKRYSILPPCVATTIRLTAKLKGVLGRARIKDFLVPRFKTFSSLIDAFNVLVWQNAAFQSELGEFAAKVDILKSSDEIEKGLPYLRSEGWLSEKEYSAITSELK